MKKLQVFEKTKSLEGRVGTFTTFDNTFTVGVGFSSAGGQAETVIDKFFTAVPEVRAAAFAAGLAVSGNNMFIVDTDKGWILEGLAAAAYLQTNTALISLLINASQGVQSYQPGQAPPAAERDRQRQGMLNAQWQNFLERTLSGIPGASSAGPSTAWCSPPTPATCRREPSRGPSGRRTATPTWSRWRAPSTDS